MSGRSGHLAAQQRGGGPGAVPHVGEPVPRDVDVPELAARTHTLAVQVDLDARVAPSDGGERVGRIGQLAPEHVGHDGPAGGRCRLAERQVEDRTQVLLELARDGAVDGPVPRVVRAHRELVDQDTRWVARSRRRDLEELDREDTRDVEADGDGPY